MAKVGIQGIAASYSEAALSLFLPAAEPVLHEDFASVFAGMATDELDQAFLPFENSTAGFISENFRLLEQSGYFVCADHIFRVEHCLLAAPGTSWAEIDAVISHPQALAQCSKLFAGETFKPEPWFDTAGAARDAARMKGKAAIASAQAASIYGLEILKRGVNDDPENSTRFLLIDRKFSWGDRLLLVCDIGELRAILLSSAKLVTMLTQPEPAVKWSHRIYLELEAYPGVSWAEWKKGFPNVKILGSFDSQR